MLYAYGNDTDGYKICDYTNNNGELHYPIRLFEDGSYGIIIGSEKTVIPDIKSAYFADLDGDDIDEKYDNLYTDIDGKIYLSDQPKNYLTPLKNQYKLDGDTKDNFYTISSLYKDSTGYYTNGYPISIDENGKMYYQSEDQVGTNIASYVPENADNKNIVTSEGVYYYDERTNSISQEQKFYVNNNDVEISNFTTPINYNGTTQQQRELYDYALALTEGYYNKDSKSKDKTYDAAMVSYYRNLFNEMRSCGYTTESKEADGVFKDKNWLVNQLKAGKLTLSYFSAQENKFMSTSLNEDSSIVEKEDKSKIAIAEQEYNNMMDRIEHQEKMLDMELTKLEAEHQALSTEYESISKIISNNISKSFNIFGNA